MLNNAFPIEITDGINQIHYFIQKIDQEIKELSKTTCETNEIYFILFLILMNVRGFYSYNQKI